MNFSHEGLSLWYGTPDAPAPGEVGIVPRRGTSMVVGVHPANPTNSVLVRYRVDGGAERTVPGREIRTDYDRNAQYFGVTFPEFLAGKVVEYLPVFSSSGRQTPAPNSIGRYPSKFQLAPVLPVAERVASAKARPVALPGARHFNAGLDFVALVHVQFGQPQYLADTAAGMRVNFVVREGTVEGDAFKAAILESSTDSMLVRRDGMGVVSIRAAFVTTDGARLDVEAGGYVDFGPDGYRRALAQALPDRAPIALTPLIATRHARYKWLSRVQCVGVGYTNLAANAASYSVYSVSSQAVK